MRRDWLCFSHISAKVDLECLINALTKSLLKQENKRNNIQRLEQAQRERRKLRTAPWEPSWFKQEKDSVTGEMMFRYQGKYWEAKDKQDWSKCPAIFNWPNFFQKFTKRPLTDSITHENIIAKQSNPAYEIEKS